MTIRILPPAPRGVTPWANAALSDTARELLAAAPVPIELLGDSPHGPWMARFRLSDRSSCRMDGPSLDDLVLRAVRASIDDADDWRLMLEGTPK